MTDALIPKHANHPDDLYADDLSHPIPCVTTIDSVVNMKSGSRYEGLVIGSPISSDVKSQKRLLKKIENYIGDIVAHRDELQASKIEHAALDMRIYVSIHPDSSREIFDLLERCKPWVEANKIKLIIE